MGTARTPAPDPPPGNNGPGWGAGRIRNAADVDRVLGAVNTAGQHRHRTAELSSSVSRADEVAVDRPDTSRILPVHPGIAELLPWPGGIRRGATVAAVGSTSLILALITEAMANGSWAAVVGMPALGALAAAEYGIDLARLALVPHPGEHWPTVVGALIDGLDIIVVATPTAPAAATTRTLMARARQRGSVLITTQPWPGGDATVQLTHRRWHGLGNGRGRLRSQDVTLTATGRGRAEQPRQLNTTLPPPPHTHAPARHFDSPQPARHPR